MKSGIYLWVNKVNNKCYIGKSVNILRRKQQHEKYINSNSFLTNAIKKYGLNNFIFIILETLEPKIENLDIAEKLWISYFISLGYKLSDTLYNHTLGGEGNFGRVHTEETKAKISAAHKNKPKSEEHKNKISSTKLGKLASSEAKTNMSKARRGKKQTTTSRKPRVLSEQHKLKIALSNSGKKKLPLSEEHKLKISLATKGKMKTEEHKQKLSLAKCRTKL